MPDDAAADKAIRDPNRFPDEWCDWWATPVVMLARGVGYGWPGEELTAHPNDPNPWFWHWCPAAGPDGDGQWMAQACPEHTLVSRDPLHMEPSLLWRCCGTHGFAREGRWVWA